MIGPSILAGSVIALLAAACAPAEPAATGNAPAEAPAEVPAAPDVETAAEPAGGSPAALELQSSGSLGFEVVAGPADGGWCAHLVPSGGAWSAAECTVSTAAAEAEGVSWAIADAPADPAVKVLYGLVTSEVSKIVVDLESGSTTTSVEAGAAPREEFGGLGSFSLFLRPSAGTAQGLRLLHAGGAELVSIDL
jgi:hypothetical protein